MNARATVWHYGCALLFVAVALLVRYALDPWLGPSLRYTMLYPAVAAAVWVGGFRPAVLASLAGYLGSDFLFREPRGTLAFDQPGDRAALLAFGLSCSVLIALGERIRRRLAAKRARLRAADEKLRIVTESMSASVTYCAYWDRALRYVWVSEPYAAWLGKSREEIEGRSIEEVLGPEAFRALSPRFERVLAGEKVQYEEEVDFLGLGRRWVQAVYTPIPPIPEDDEPAQGWVAVVLDLTERKRMEEALRASEERFHRFMNASPLPAHIKDREGRYVYANSHVEQKLGGSVVGRTDFDLYPSDAAEEMRRNDRMVLESGRIARFHEITVERDGRHDYLSFKFPLEDPEGRKLVAAVSMDLTEQKRAEQAVREGEERFRNLADNAPVLIWLNDLDGCQFVNRAYLDFTGRPMEELRGMKWAEAIHPEDAREYLEQYERAFSPRRNFDAQCRFRRFDGEYRWVKSVGVPRFTPDGSFLGYVGCALDISEIKDYEKTLKEQDSRKDEFLATLAHELRNPLAPIQSAIDVLKASGPKVPELMWARDVIDRQVHLMARLLDDLLDVNRITRGKLELRMERVDLHSIVGRAVETSRPIVEMSGHQLEIDLPTDQVPLYGDPVRLEQVLSNLLNNASRYTNRGGHLRLSAQAGSEEVVIRVRDDGVGISPEVLPRVLDLFTRGPFPGGPQEGMGIGLSLVRNLVAMHGGRVEAKNNSPDAGSEFVVRLPATGNPAESSPRPTPSASTIPLRRRRIVVADDNRDAAESLGMILRILGHEVWTAYDGIEAMRLASEFRPEVLVLDIGMPGLNGYEAARRIRQEPWGRGVALLALSGWGQEEDKRKARGAGFDHHLTKPVEASEIEKVLERLKADAPAER